MVVYIVIQYYYMGLESLGLSLGHGLESHSARLGFGFEFRTVGLGLDARHVGFRLDSGLGWTQSLIYITTCTDISTNIETRTRGHEVMTHHIMV